MTGEGFLFRFELGPTTTTSTTTIAIPQSSVQDTGKFQRFKSPSLVEPAAGNLCCRAVLDIMGPHCPVPLSSGSCYGKRVFGNSVGHVAGHAVQCLWSPCPVDPVMVETHLLDISPRLAYIILIRIRGGTARDGDQACERRGSVT